MSNIAVLTVRRVLMLPFPLPTAYVVYNADGTFLTFQDYAEAYNAFMERGLRLYKNDQPFAYLLATKEPTNYED